jgi:hypothetical protein
MKEGQAKALDHPRREGQILVSLLSPEPVVQMGRGDLPLPGNAELQQDVEQRHRIRTS